MKGTYKHKEIFQLYFSSLDDFVALMNFNVWRMFNGPLLRRLFGKLTSVFSSLSFQHSNNMRLKHICVPHVIHGSSSLVYSIHKIFWDVL